MRLVYFWPMSKYGMSNIEDTRSGAGLPTHDTAGLPHPSPTGTQVQPPQHQPSNTQSPSRSRKMAVAALIVSIVAFLSGWVPVLGLLLGVVGITLGIVTLVKRQSKALAITSLVLASLAVLASTVSTVVVTSSTTTDNAPGSSESAETEGKPAADPATDTEAPASEPEAAAPDLATFGELDERTFALLVKDPDAHVGENLIVYGSVFQFDSFTGKCSFMADTAQGVQTTSYDYAQNTMVWAGDQESDCPILAPIVEGDHVKIWATVQGSYSYDTQSGGSTNALLLEAHQVELLPATEY